jgi:ribose 5-phosphate isomerase A
MTEVDDQKRRAAEAAALLVEEGMIVGLGTGSTAVFFVRALAARGLQVRCVATSVATGELAASLGLTVLDLDAVDAIDLTVDGADEIGPGLDVIKGAGGALLREKLVWQASRRCVVIADARKPVTRLGAFALPVEVVAFGARSTVARLWDVFQSQGVPDVPKLRLRDGDPMRTDGGNLIYDVTCGVIDDPAALAAAIKAVTGVVDHGLFLGLAERALVGGPTGVDVLFP